MTQTNRLALATLTIALGAGLTAPAGEFEITRATIDGGGVVGSTGGGFSLSSTIGQPDGGVLSGGSFTLAGGFWFETPPGDCEDDGDVDLYDHESFESCIAGPRAGIMPGCECFDIDRSGNIDMADFAVAQSSFTGS